MKNLKFMNNEKNMVTDYCENNIEKNTEELKKIYQKKCYELFSLEEEMNLINVENIAYNKYKKDVIKCFCKNFFEIGTVIYLIGAFSSFVFKIDPSLVFKICTILFATTETILFSESHANIKDFLSNKDVDNYNGLNIEKLEEEKEELREYILNIEKKINANIMKENKKNNESIIMSPSNNIYNDKKNEKTKKKIIKKI